MIELIIKNELGSVIGRYPVETERGVTRGVLHAIEENHLVLVDGDTLEIREGEF